MFERSNFTRGCGGGVMGVLLARKLRPETQWCVECPSISLVLLASDVVNGEVRRGRPARGGLSRLEECGPLSPEAARGAKPPCEAHENTSPKTTCPTPAAPRCLHLRRSIRRRSGGNAGRRGWGGWFWGGVFSWRGWVDTVVWLPVRLLAIQVRTLPTGIIRRRPVARDGLHH